MAMRVSRDDGTSDPVFRRTGSGPEATAPPAGWPRRVGARLLDSLLIFFPGYLAVDVVVQRVMGLRLTTSEDLLAEETLPLLPGDVIAAFVLFGIWVAYETYFVSRWGRTPGKVLLGIKVIPVNEDIIPLGVNGGDAARRAMLLNLPTAAAWTPSLVITALNLFVLLAVLWPLWDRPYRQGLHDKAARTRVVHVVVPRFSSSTLDPRGT